MKTAANLLLVLFVSGTLLTTACTPKDELVTKDPAVRAKINKKAAKQDGSKKSFQFSAYPTAVLLLEKQIEAVSLLRVALGEELPAGRAQLVDKVEGAAGYTALLKWGSEPFQYSTDKGSFKSTISKSLNAQIFQQPREDGVLVQMTKEGAENDRQSQAKYTVDKADGSKTYANLFENVYELILSQDLQNEDLYLVKLLVKGHLNGALAGSRSSENFEMNLELAVEKNSFETEEVKIVRSSGTLTFVKARPYSVGIAAQGSSLKIQDRCHSLTIQAEILKQRNPTVVAYQDDVVSVGTSKFRGQKAACGQRPTLDLSLLFL